ncbi:MAG TPA: sensor domain-containing protein, partial [Mycobacterium sp.]|nr:sensor domain-containing protein [Mycobacterium sp.]
MPVRVGYTGVKSEVLAGAGAGQYGPSRHSDGGQLPRRRDASNYFTDAAASWVGCANRDIDYMPVSGDHQPWTIGKRSVDAKRTVIEVTQAAKNGSSACERAITMKTKIVID